MGAFDDGLGRAVEEDAPSVAAVAIVEETVIVASEQLEGFYKGRMGCWFCDGSTRRKEGSSWAHPHGVCNCSDSLRQGASAARRAESDWPGCAKFEWRTCLAEGCVAGSALCLVASAERRAAPGIDILRSIMLVTSSSQCESRKNDAGRKVACLLHPKPSLGQAARMHDPGVHECCWSSLTLSRSP